MNSSAELCQSLCAVTALQYWKVVKLGLRPSPESTQPSQPVEIRYLVQPAYTIFRIEGLPAAFSVLLGTKERDERADNYTQSDLQHDSLVAFPTLR